MNQRRRPNNDRTRKIAIARREAERAKTALLVAGIVGMGVYMLGARLNHAGTAKGHSTPLAAPARFEQAVQQDTALQSGVIAPPVQAPASVAAATS